MIRILLSLTFIFTFGCAQAPKPLTLTSQRPPATQAKSEENQQSPNQQRDWQIQSKISTIDSQISALDAQIIAAQGRVLHLHALKTTAVDGSLGHSMIFSTESQIQSLKAQKASLLSRKLALLSQLRSSETSSVN